MSTQLNYEIKNHSRWIGESYHIARGKRWNYKQLGFPDAAQIVPAKKENGSLTICVNYRGLNSKAIPSSYLVSQ